MPNILKHMEAKTQERYAANAETTQIPDQGLGEFVNGFTEESGSFNWTSTLWSLLPGAGHLFFVGHKIKHWLIGTHHDRVLLYKNGFIKQVLDGNGQVRKETIFRFNELNGVFLGKTRKYRDVYGIGKYNATNVQFSVLDKNNVKEEVLAATYRNEKDIEGKYNFIGCASDAINNAWRQFAINKSKIGYWSPSPN